MLNQLVKYPAYIFKFAIYILFLCFAVLFYFSNINAELTQNIRTLYSAMLFLYGAYRTVRTYQDFKKEIASNNEQ
jgi:hypothetical protein